MGNANHLGTQVSRPVGEFWFYFPLLDSSGAPGGIRDCGGLDLRGGGPEGRPQPVPGAGRTAAGEGQAAGEARRGTGAQCGGRLLPVKRRPVDVAGLTERLAAEA